MRIALAFFLTVGVLVASYIKARLTDRPKTKLREWRNGRVEDVD